MFMAVDIVGSTNFKLRFGEEPNQALWLEPFERFFRWAPVRFVGHVAHVCAHEPEIPRSRVFRVRGDEIIFMSRLSRPEDARLLSIAFMNTVADCAESILGDWGLKVRGGCWGAQLSGRNVAIAIPEIHHGFLDYLGPDVDAGFRLVSCAPEGEVAFSYNLIHLLASSSTNVDLRFRHLEDRVLTGVIEHLPYPIVASSSSAQKDPTRYPETPQTLVEWLATDHPASQHLKHTQIQF